MSLDASLLDMLDGLLAWLGPAGTRSLRALAVVVTPLGSSAVLASIVVAAAAGLALRRRRHDAIWLAATCMSGWAAMHAMKLAFARPRPDVAGHLVEAVGASFPSGHAMMSTVVALSLWQLSRRADGSGDARASIDAPPRGSQALLAALAAAIFALVVAIGVSRVVVGVHWPSDVLAGWALGAAWSALAWTRRPAPAPPAG